MSIGRRISNWLFEYLLPWNFIGPANCGIPNLSRSNLLARAEGYPLDRVRVLQGHGLGAVQDAARADPDTQRHDAGPARRQDALR
jgi:hypothetical protein